MIARVLPPEEWGRLEVTKLPSMCGSVRPEDLRVVGVEDSNGNLLATMSVVRVVHFETAWIDPEFRGNPGVARRLWSKAVETAKSFTDKWVWAPAENEQMRSIIQRLGGIEMPVSSFVIPIGD